MGDEMIYFLVGDITDIDEGNAIIAHIVNNIGAFGGGVSGAIGEMYPSARKAYLNWAKDDVDTLELGKCLFLHVNYADKMDVCHMVAQNGLRSNQNPSPIDMEALNTCLRTLFMTAQVANMSVHLPKIGSGLAGGNWDEILLLIEYWSDKFKVKTYIYEYNASVTSYDEQYDTTS